MTERFEKAYNALLKAYFKGTLAKGICTACAVGNIVCDAMDGEIIYQPMYNTFERNVDNSFWWRLFYTPIGSTKQINTIKDKPGLAEHIKKLTNYSAEELAKVEYAFETNTKITHKNYCQWSEQEVLEDQFNGLSAVVDVLIKLDNLENADKKYNKAFRQHPKLLC